MHRSRSWALKSVELKPYPLAFPMMATIALRIWILSPPSCSLVMSIAEHCVTCDFLRTFSKVRICSGSVFVKKPTTFLSSPRA